MQSMPTSAKVLTLALGLAGARDSFTDNPICLKNNCVKPIFPGLQDLHELSETKFYCSDMQETRTEMDFCKAAVNYDVGLPQPTTKAEESIAALVRKQDARANQVFLYHLAGLGKEAWDYTDPSQSDDDCVKAIWRMACWTHFPRAKAGCTAGNEMEYIRPCQSSCQNYIQSCGVECCDESVQCVFRHKKELTETTALITTGYAPHDGPSSLCTGGARGLAPGALWLLPLLAALVGQAEALPSARSSGLLALLAVSATALGGCDPAATTHKVGNWRMEEDYLVKYQFVPPGASSKEAVLNSCSVPALSPLVQCNGHGTCVPWPKTTDTHPQNFCKCESGWADPECRTKRKSQAVAWLLAVFLGPVGADRFYLGLTISAIMKMVLLGSLCVYWSTEVLITGSGPVSTRCLKSWPGLIKIGFFFCLAAWYFVDVIRTGSAPVETNGFRTAPDLPRPIFVAVTVFVSLGVGFALASQSIMSQVGERRKSLWLMQQAYSAEKEALDQGVMTSGNRDAAYGAA